MKFPRHLERQLAARLRRRMRMISGIIREELHRRPKHDEAGPALPPSWWRRLLDRVLRALGLAAPITASSLLATARAVDSTVSKGITSTLEEASPGLALPALRPLAGVQQEWATVVAARVQALEERAVREAIQAAREAAVPEQAAARVLATAETRAAVLARDVVGTLTSRITASRSPALGADSYVWVTQHDDRVRPAHQELDGTIHSWSDPGPDAGYYPGEAPNCRCIARPV